MDEQISVSKEALRQVLNAFQGPSHHVMELWAINKPYIDNPVTQLIQEFNSALTPSAQVGSFENVALKAEVERLREQLKPIIPPWSPDYGSGPVTPDRVFMFQDEYGAWHDIKKLDLGIYINDGAPVRELFTKPYWQAKCPVQERDGYHKLDTPSQVFFYEQDFYVLSNFSAFSVTWDCHRFDTTEAAYHWCKFPHMLNIREEIYNAESAHDAFKIAERHKVYQRADWDEVKVDVMREILKAKVEQHEYVRRKLLATGERELIEDSWRDDFWGWGPNRDGKNMLGKLWMEIRQELRTAEGLEQAKKWAS